MNKLPCSHDHCKYCMCITGWMWTRNISWQPNAFRVPKDKHFSSCGWKSTDITGVQWRWKFHVLLICMEAKRPNEMSKEAQWRIFSKCWFLRTQMSLRPLLKVTYSGYQSHVPSHDFFPFRKLHFGGRQSNVSMAITASRVSRTIISVSILWVSELFFRLYLTCR